MSSMLSRARTAARPLTALLLLALLLTLLPATRAQAATEPIESTGTAGSSQTVHGNVYIDRSGAYYRQNADDQPLAGQQVFGYWVDRDGRQSSTYVTTVNDDGTYHLTFPDWTDNTGKTHTFAASAFERVRVWTPSRDDLVLSFAEGYGRLASSVDRQYATWDAAMHVINNFNFAFNAKPNLDLHNLPAQPSMVEPDARVGRWGTISGTVFLDNVTSEGWISYPAFNSTLGDTGVGGITVTASYTDSEGKIVETRSTTSQPNGKWIIGFAGEDSDTEDFGFTDTWNTRRVYVSIDMPDGARYTTLFRENEYWNGDALGNGAAATVNKDVIGVNFALYTAATFEIPTYDTADNPAPAGTTLTTNTRIIPAAGQKFEIVWSDPNGTPVASCTDLEVQPDGTLAPCPFASPANLSSDSVYTATLKDASGNPLEVASALVKARDNTPPTLAPIADQTINRGEAMTPVTVEVDDPEAKIAVGGLPNGVSYDPETGQITGTPTTTGRFEVTVTATDAFGNAVTETFTLTVLPPADVTAPGITPISDQSVELGDAVTPITVTVDDPDATVVVRDLPDGLSYDPTTGTITGTPTEPGTYPVTVVATDAAGNTASETFVIVVKDTTAPRIDPIDDQRLDVGDPIAPVTVSVDDRDAKVTVSGLPDGVTYDPETRRITGTPSTAGTSTVTVTATDAAGNSASETFTITVGDGTPVIAAIDDQTTELGDAIDPVTVEVSDPEATVTATGLPDGVTFDPSTGVISGTPSSTGTFPVTVTATHGADHSSTETFTITVRDTAAPKIGPMKDQEITLTESIAPVGVTVDDPKADVTVSGLPAGVSFDRDSSQITGTPGAVGTYQVTVTATDQAGNSTQSSFVITVRPSADTSAPTISPIPNQNVELGDDIAPATVTVDDKDAKVEVSGLPDGVSYDPATGDITGKPTKPGTYPVTVTATDAANNQSTISFTITVSDTAAPKLEPIANQSLELGEGLTPVTVKVDDPSATVKVIGLPGGTSFDPETGTITGTPTTPGSWPVTVTATDPYGNSSTVTFTVSVTDTRAPGLDPIDDQSVKLGDAVGPIAVTVDDKTATVQVTGLPDGVTYDESTGTITGTPTATGTSSVTVTATDPSGNATSQSFTITVTDATPPKVTPISDQTVESGNPIDPIKVVVDDPEASVEVTGLPDGVTYDPTTGEISGTPGTTGATTVTVTATDPAGNTTTETFVITVQDTTAPAITPIEDQIVDLGQGITPVTVAVDDPDATITVDGLPAGVTYDPATGVISGVPTTGGSATVTVTATDPAGNTATETFTVTVRDTTGPAIKGIGDQVVELGDPIKKVTVEVDDTASSIVVTGLPDGVTYDPATGEISGRPTAVGTSTVSVKATDAAGHETIETFTITVRDTRAPKIDPIKDQELTVGEKVRPITVKTDDPSAKVTLAGLPDGVVYDPATGTITGRPTQPGVYQATVTATDAAGNTASTTFTITVRPDRTPPAIDPIDDQSVKVGKPIKDITVKVDDPQASVEVTGLPDGVTYDPETGTISGTPSTPGTSTVTVTAKDPAGNTTTETFIITVKDKDAPRITPVPNQSVSVGSGLPPITITVDKPATVKVEGLPDGVTFDPETGTISGTPIKEGTYPVTVTATDADGNVSQMGFTITVRPQGTPGGEPGESGTGGAQPADPAGRPDAPARPGLLAATGGMGLAWFAGALALLSTGGVLLWRSRRREQ